MVELTGSAGGWSGGRERRKRRVGEERGLMWREEREVAERGETERSPQGIHILPTYCDRETEEQVSGRSVLAAALSREVPTQL